MKCSDFIEGLAELAFGNESAAALQHVGGCSSCARTLSELQKVVGTLGFGTTRAPQSVVDLAIAIGPPARRLPLIRSTLVALGARKADADSFQRVFDAGSFQVRVMYSKTGAGWNVMVGTDSRAVLKSEFGFTVEGGNGNYEFVAETLEQTGFKLDAGTLSISIPPGSEPLEDDDLA